MKKITTEMKVGLFAVGLLVILAYMTLKVSERGTFRGGSYFVTVIIDSAEGLTEKTPVEVAGILVGYVDKLHLHEGQKAKAKLRINREVRLGTDARAQVRVKGFLGETYIDLLPGDTAMGTIPEGGTITATNPYVDLGQIASDVRELTASMKNLLSEENGVIPRILKHMDILTDNLGHFSEDLNNVMTERKEGLKDTLKRLDLITRDVEEGRGTLGRLLKDEEIADNINEAAKGVSDTVGGVSRFQFELGYHLEYLGVTKDFKNYVGLALRPRPDKAFLLDLVADPEPSPVRKETTTNTTTGGVTTTTVTTEDVVERDNFLVSAQLAKSFYDFTLRGGIIESRGGVGLDYNLGPLGIGFSAFDFRTDNNEKPHLKLLGSFNLTDNLYLLSGIDDFISNQHNPDWFVGAGIRLIDNDLRSLMGAASLRK